MVVPEVVIREFARHRTQESKSLRAEAARKSGVALRAMQAAHVDLPQRLPSVRELRSPAQPTAADAAEGIRQQLSQDGVVIPVISTTLDHKRFGRLVADRAPTV